MSGVTSDVPDLTMEVETPRFRRILVGLAWLGRHRARAITDRQTRNLNILLDIGWLKARVGLKLS